MRMLGVFACYGNKQIHLLKQLIASYQRMAFAADIVVLTESPKGLGADVEEMVGLPAKNPWSLPFAHKKLFVERQNDYDLFVYSEDDMLLTEAHIAAFLDLSTHLEPDEIPGFLRYELDPAGNKFLPDVHGMFHWKPDSVRKRGPYTVAEFNNEHSAFYLLTREQLQRAIRSGGFLREPCEGRYDMLCTAATDPYVNCGLKKVVCISELDSFLVHHMSNRYAGRMGLPLSSFRKQVDALFMIEKGILPDTSLCAVESRLGLAEYSKSYYEPASREVLDSIPKGSRSILSVGSGSGALEREMIAMGATVTSIPLDAVIGSSQDPGINVVNKTLDDCLGEPNLRGFDCVVVSNLLHLSPQPDALIEMCINALKPGGTAIFRGPNLKSASVLFARALNRKNYRSLRSYAESGINSLSGDSVCRSLKKRGLNAITCRWFNETEPKRYLLARRFLGPFGKNDWIVSAIR